MDISNYGGVIMLTYPKEIFTGYWGNNHCQGIAVDKKRLS